MKKSVLSFFIGVCCCASVSCGPAADKTESASIRIVTTIGQISDIVKNIGGDLVSVEGLMGPGVDPHLYQASEGDVQKLSRADIIFYNGLHLEAKMADIFKKMQQRKKTVAVAEAIPVDRLLSDQNFKDYHDPHVWFDVELWKMAAVKVHQELTAWDPAHKEEYDRNAEQYLRQLNDLDVFIKEKIANIPQRQRVLVTAHDAFRYFGRRYGIEVIGLQGLSTEAEAGAADVKELAEFIVERKIPAIFVESSVPERNIKAVQEAVKSRGWDVKIGGELFSDAMGSAKTLEGTYVGMVRHNVNTIHNALTGAEGSNDQ